MNEDGKFVREQPRGLQVETVTAPGGGEVSYCPGRGGIMTSLKLGGTEVLYLEEDTFQNTQGNVRGGVPILFPNAGPLEGEEYPGLKQHGFARKSSGWVIREHPEGGFAEALEADDASREVYPHDFKLTMSGQFEQDGSFTLVQAVENRDSDKAMPVSMGLHPYFRVSSEEKGNIRFEFDGGDEVERRSDEWANGDAVSINNPKVTDPGAEMRVHIPSLGTLVIEASAEYEKIWVWSLPEKDFICIEPVMRDVGGLVKNPEKVEPGDVLSAEMNMRLE